MEEINFTKCKELICEYGGSEKKKKIEYNNSVYLLKFPDPVIKDNLFSFYKYNTISTYIGCKIFSSIDIPTQEVIIGAYDEESTIMQTKKKVVVACKDFINIDARLVEFSSLANSVTEVDKKFTTDITHIYEVINKIFCDKDKMISKFWDMFVVDTLIGNVDRHLSNFGFIISNNEIDFAPVYDCGSTLHPLLSDEKMQEILKSETDFKNTVFSIYPIYKYDSKKLTYNEFYLKNIEDLNKALLRIYPKIDMDKINLLIDDTPYISDVRKGFLKKSILFRKENILEKAYNKLITLHTKCNVNINKYEN